MGLDEMHQECQAQMEFSTQFIKESLGPLQAVSQRVESLEKEIVVKEGLRRKIHTFTSKVLDIETKLASLSHEEDRFVEEVEEFQQRLVKGTPIVLEGLASRPDLKSRWRPRELGEGQVAMGGAVRPRGVVGEARELVPTCARGLLS